MGLSNWTNILYQRIISEGVLDVPILSPKLSNFLGIKQSLLFCSLCKQNKRSGTFIIQARQLKKKRNQGKRKAQNQQDHLYYVFLWEFGALLLCFVLFSVWCFSFLVCHFRFLIGDHVSRKIMGWKIIKTGRFEIWGQVRTCRAAGNEPHRQLLQGQDILYIICKK